jgi:hypothetical protein
MIDFKAFLIMTNNDYNYYSDNDIIITEVLILIFLNIYQS